MYPSHPHIASLYSAAGFAWLLLALLVCAVVTHISYPAFLHDCVTVVFSKISRRYSDTTRLTTAVFSHLFLLGTLALGLWLCLYAGGSLRWLHYGLMIALVSVWLLLRFLVSRFLGNVFSFRPEARAIHEDSMLLLMLAGMAFYALCSIAPWIPIQAVFRRTVAVIIALYIIVLTGKVTVTYARSLKMLFYIFLYVLTLEVIPLAMLYGVASYITAVV